jgi:hypothetical protein
MDCSGWYFTHSKKVPHQPLKVLAYGEAGDIKLSKRDSKDMKNIKLTII